MLLGTQDKDFFPKDMIEKFRFMKEMGFECFEIDGKVLVENLEEVKKAIKETGLPVCTDVYKRQIQKRRESRSCDEADR